MAYRRAHVVGFKIIFGTDETSEECEAIIYEALGKLTNRTGVDYLSHLEPNEIEDELKKMEQQ